MEQIPVKYNGVTIGHVVDYNENGPCSIKFLDTEEAKEIVEMINSGTTVSISSRGLGRINENGKFEKGEINMFDVMLP